MKRLFTLAIMGLGLGIGACAEGPVPIETPGAAPSGEQAVRGAFSGMPDDTWHTGVTAGAPVAVDLLPSPEPLVRPRRRMDVDQLRRSFYRVTHGIGWTRVQNGVVIDRFQEFEATLGKPDYIQSTLEDLSPGALFQKFLGDAAREVCATLLDRELVTADGARVFWTEVDPKATPLSDHEGIVDNLVALKLRYHGKVLSADDPALAQFLWLFESSYHIAQDPKVAWNTVCVGLFTHPDFYTY